jgi:hypothetical protein
VIFSSAFSNLMARRLTDIAGKSKIGRNRVSVYTTAPNSTEHVALPSQTAEQIIVQVRDGPAAHGKKLWKSRGRWRLANFPVKKISPFNLLENAIRFLEFPDELRDHLDVSVCQSLDRRHIPEIPVMRPDTVLGR